MQVIIKYLVVLGKLMAVNTLSLKYVIDNSGIKQQKQQQQKTACYYTEFNLLELIHSGEVFKAILTIAGVRRVKMG